MPQTLLDHKLKKCTDFANRLFEFQDSLNGPNIEACLDSLHTSFLLLLNSFAIRPPPTPTRNEEEEGLLMRVKIHDVTLLVFENLIIDVDENHPELARFFVNKWLEEAEDMAEMLWDYEERPCDGCGNYFTKLNFETPVLRTKMEDFTLAFHEKCFGSNSFADS